MNWPSKRWKTSEMGVNALDSVHYSPNKDMHPGLTIWMNFGPIPRHVFWNVTRDICNRVLFSYADRASCHFIIAGKTEVSLTLHWPSQRSIQAPVRGISAGDGAEVSEETARGERNEKEEEWSCVRRRHRWTRAFMVAAPAGMVPQAPDSLCLQGY